MELAVQIFMIYLLVGVIFSIAFVFRGAQVVDHGAKGVSVWFKLLLIPGAIALWPVLLVKWFKANRR